MILVKETVFKDDGSVEHVSEKQWSLKFRFLNSLRKLNGVSGFVIQDLSSNNKATFTIDGVRREIEISPQLYLGSDDE